MHTAEVVVTRELVQEETHQDAFLRLIVEYEPALRRLAGVYLRQPADREDLFQEIAVALWQAIPRFRGESTVRTWLYRIAHNVALSSAAKLYRRGATEQAGPVPTDPQPAPRDAEHEILRVEKQRLLAVAIRELPVIDRQIVLLHLEGLAYAEIVEVCGLSETAVATRLSRIREKLKEKIQAKEVGRP